MGFVYEGSSARTAGRGTGKSPSPAKTGLVSVIATLNINCNPFSAEGLVSKAPRLMALLRKRPGALPGVIMLQEAGILGGEAPRALEKSFPGHRAFVCSSREGQHRLVPFNISLVMLVAKNLGRVIGKVSRAPSRAAMAVRVGKVLLVNTYWPSGLDGVSTQPERSSSNAVTADHVHSTIDWIAEEVTKSGLRHWVIGGDLNETVVHSERESGSGGSSPKRRTFIASLKAKLNAVDAGTVTGCLAHTFFTRRGGGSANRPVSSRLDRFLVSVPTSFQLLEAQVARQAASSRPLSDHRMVLLTTAALPFGKRSLRPDWRQKKFIVPGAEDGGLARQLAFHTANSYFAHRYSEVIKSLDRAMGEVELESSSLALFEALRTSAAKAFRQTNPQRPRKPGHSRRAADISRVKRQVVSLRRLYQQLTPPSVDQVVALWAPLVVQLDKLDLRDTSLPVPTLGAHFVGQIEGWAQRQLRFLRRMAKLVKKNLKVNWDSYTQDAEGLSTFAAKFAKPGRPPPVRSVPDPATGFQTEDPLIVGQVLLDRVTGPMRTPVNAPRKRAPDGHGTVPGFPDEWVRRYAPADSVEAGWWDGLMRAPSWTELRTILSKAKKHTSPGEGGLGVDVLQCMSAWEVPLHASTSEGPGPIASALLAFLRAVLRVGVYPSHLCVAWITTIGKGSDDPLDVRPISVLPELYRLVSRLLNLRLTGTFLGHEILHPAQRAAIADGDFHQAVDATCQVFEDARERVLSTLACILYDQSKAFDLVHAEALDRAMRRIKLPESFRRLILSAMARAKSRVRTCRGLSPVTSLLRSLRQGDPLASILYCIYIDPLHWALSESGGYVMKNGTLVSSLAFMDDTNVLANDFEQLSVLHERVIAFSLINDARINAKKTRLLLADHKGEGEDRQLFSDLGEAIKPVLPGTTVRYLGVWINLEGKWDKMHSLFKRTFWRVFFTIKNNEMTSRAAALMVNVFLISSVQRMLRLACFVFDPAMAESLGVMQKALNELFARLNGLPLPSLWGGSITPLLFGFKDLAQHAKTLNVEQLHLNLNYDPQRFLVASSTHDRLASYCQTGNAPEVQRGPGQPPVDLLAPALRAVQSKLEWGGSPPNPPSTNDTAKRMSLLHVFGLTLLPNARNLRSLAMEVDLIPEQVTLDALYSGPPSGAALRLFSSLQEGGAPFITQIDPYSWDWTSGVVRAPASLPVRHVVVYPDGSSKRGEDSGASAVWYIPGDDQAAAVVTARLRASSENYLAECTGCLMALHFTPVNWPLTVCCDCLSALYTTTKPRHRVTARKRLTAAARPALECSRALLEIREAPTHWMKVRSHTGASDIDAKGSEKADLTAKWARGGFRPRQINRLWKQGAEPAMLCSWNMDSQGGPRWKQRRLMQVTGRVRAHLDRLETDALAKRAKGAKTMGLSLRYNQGEVLATVRQLLRSTSSKTHALVVMALTKFLPLRNRLTFGPPADPTATMCDWCATGLKQSSTHIFGCPALAAEAFQGFVKMGTHVFPVGVDASGGGREAPEAKWGVGRTRLVRDKLISLTSLHWEPDGEGGPGGRTPTLSSAQLKLTPHAVGRLCQDWAGSWQKKDPVLSLPGSGCLARVWAEWLRLESALVGLHSSEPPSHRSTAPHPGVLEGLSTLERPFWAVVVDGPAWIAPPTDMLWYRSSPEHAAGAWWAHSLPDSGEGLHLFEWAPLAGPRELAVRVAWWAEAVRSSPSTLLMVVVPAEAWVDELLHQNSLVSLSQTARAGLWRCGLNGAPWNLESAGFAHARVLLLTAELGVALRHWGAALIAEVVSLLEAPRDAGTFRTDSSSPAGSLLPAHWWWGPTAALFPAGRCRGSAPGGSRGTRSLPCGQDGTCGWVCSSGAQAAEVDCYLGNLGIAPPEFSGFTLELDPGVLGAKDPPEWRRACWSLLSNLCDGVGCLSSTNLRRWPP